jgi:hypothetical protein
MEEGPPIIEEQPRTAPAAVHHTSLLARLVNVFAIPGEVFQEIRATPRNSWNWLAPMLLFALVSALSGLVFFSQPAVQQKMKEQQQKAIDRQIQIGRIKREDADRASQIFTPQVTKAFGGVFWAIVGAASVLWWAFIIWMLGRVVLKSSFPFSKSLEITGMAMMIRVLGSVITVLLTVNLSRLVATPSLALVVTDFDATRKSHLLLGAANVFSFWMLGVLGVGLARLAGVPFVRAAFPVAAFWLAQEALFILSGLGQLAL